MRLSLFVFSGYKLLLFLAGLVGCCRLCARFFEGLSFLVDVFHSARPCRLGSDVRISTNRTFVHVDSPSVFVIALSAPWHQEADNVIGRLTRFRTCTR